jgi:hypothetical protein
MQAALALSTSNIQSLPPPHEFTFFCEPRHDEAPPPGVAEQQQQQQPGTGQQSAAGAASQQAGGQLVAAGQGAGEGLVSKWRQKERLKTTAVALVMCLNIGVRNRLTGCGDGSCDRRQASAHKFCCSATVCVRMLLRRGLLPWSPTRVCCVCPSAPGQGWTLQT